MVDLSLVEILKKINLAANTLLMTLYEGQVDEVTLDMAVGAHIAVIKESDNWYVLLNADDFSMVFGKEEPGVLPAYDTTLRDAIPSLTSFLDEDETERFIENVEKLETLTKEAVGCFESLETEDIFRQSKIAMMVSHWISVTLYLNECEFFYDEEILHGEYDLDIVDSESKIRVSHDLIEADIDLETGEVTLVNHDMPLLEYLSVSFKDTGLDYELGHITMNLDSITEIACNN